MKKNNFLNVNVILRSIGLVFLLAISFSAQSLDYQADIQAKKFYAKMYKKCGEYYYHKYVYRGIYLFQCKYPPTFSTKGTTYQPKQLSEADRLNGVDPLPIAWRGYTKIDFGLCRYQLYDPEVGPGYDAWGAWSDRNDDYLPLGMTNRKGVWEFYHYKTRVIENFSPVSCDEIPGATKRTEVKEPSWGNEDNYGWKLFSLPANYGRWFYLGTGPMAIKLPSTFSRIYIDGSNKAWSPQGGSYSAGVQETSSDAIAPNLLLGAIIVKLGENGEPFQLFSNNRFSYEIKSNDSVYIAINDSYFGDNKGEHVVYVKGKNLKTQLPLLNLRNPLNLIVRITPYNKIMLNREEMESHVYLSKYLSEIFSQRKNNFVFREGTNEVEKTVLIVIPSNSRNKSTNEIIKAIELAGASPIKTLTEKEYEELLNKKSATP